MVKAQQPGDDVLNNAANDDVNNAADDDLNSASDNDMNNVAARIQCAETPSLLPLFDVTKKEFAIDVTQTEFAKTVVIFDDDTAETKDGEKCKRKTFKLTKGENKGVILVRYYPAYEVEPTDVAMKLAYTKMMKSAEKTAADKEMDKNRKYAYTSYPVSNASIIHHHSSSTYHHYSS